MWYLTPKNLFLYWGTARPLSYFRFLTVKSFAELNPEWNIEVYYDHSPVGRSWGIGRHERVEDYRGENYFDSLKQFAKIKKFDFSNTPVKDSHDIHKSDYLRWHLLRDYGGVWSDFDIYYTKPITALKENIEENKDKELFLPKYLENKFAIGFIIGNKEAKGLVACCDSIEAFYSRNAFQSIGADLLHSIEDKLNYSPLDPIGVYPTTYRHIQSHKEKIPNSIGIHWYGGSKYMEPLENSEQKTKEWIARLT